MADRKPVLIVAGPTASGKSSLALAIAEAFNGVVINADSMQVYRELRVLTARPEATDEARAPHRLYGVLPVREVCSAARWREMAIAEIRDAHDEGMLPVICGGTGLYLRALTQGLSPMPDIPDAIRQTLRTRLEREGSEALHRDLAARDPETAARLLPVDSQRVLRALEVLEATGRPLAEWQALPPDGAPADLRFVTLLLLPPRDLLYAACDRRLESMVHDGALDEVRTLMSLGLDRARPAMKALGVAQLAHYLGGNCSLEEAVAAAQQATRHYAKRQMTWFRHQIIANRTITEQFSERLKPKIFSFIRQTVLTGRE